MKQRASALASMHECGIVHRDLKPGNVLLAESEDVKLADFGLARKYNAFITVTQRDRTSTQYMETWAGTIHWMAPEVFAGHYTEETDIFSLGVMFSAILERDFLDIDGKTFYGVFSCQPPLGEVGVGYAMYWQRTDLPVIFSEHAQGSNEPINVKPQGWGGGGG